MAIRFACPACQQPLEIDDAWSGQSVACPYCQRVITAPRTSNWPAGDVPMAAPARPEGVPPQPGFAPPPPPPGLGARPHSPPRRGSAGWALALVIFGALLSMAAGFTWSLMVTQHAHNELGADASPQEIQKLIEKKMMEGQLPTHPAPTGMAVLSTLLGLAGLTLAIRSLIYQESGRGLAITACVVGALFLVCQIMLMWILLGVKGVGSA